MLRAALVACLLAASASAAAAPGDRQRAAQLLDEGRRLFEAGRPREALDRFRAAHAQFPSPKILFNIGHALGRLGREFEAAEAFDRFLVESATDPDVSDERRAAARRELAALTARVGRLRLEVAPAAARVTIDERPLGVPPPRVAYVAPGPHRVRAELEGHRPAQLEVEVAAGEARPVALRLEALPPVAAAPPPVTAPEPAPAPPPPPAERPARSRGWVWAAAGTAAAMLVGALVFKLRADSAYDELRRTDSPRRYDELEEQVSTQSTASNVMLGLGAAAGAGAAVLYFVF